MEKMSYNDRVKMITEEMCIQEIDRKFGDGTYLSRHLTESNRKAMHEHFSFAARTAVAKMAEAVKHALITHLPWTDETNMIVCERHLIEYGLVPDKHPDTPTENNNWKL